MRVADRSNVGWKTLVVVVGALAISGCDPALDNPLFEPEDIAALNEGKFLDSTHPKLAHADEVCLIGLDNIKGYKFKGCVLTNDQAIALIKDDQCTLYSMDGFQGRVQFQHDRECKPVAPGFRMKTFHRYGIDHLIFWDD